MAALPPVPQPVGRFNEYVARGPEMLILKEKVMSLSGDSFDIKLGSGAPIFKVQGSAMSLSGRKAVFDMAGKHLFDIKKEHFHLHATYVAEDPQGAKLLEVKSSFKLIGSKATATFTSSNGKQEVVTMKGNWRDSSADIVDEAQGGLVIARIKRKFNARHVLFGQQEYAVEIAPGVDMAIVAAMCICFDEANNENNGS